MRVAFTPPFDTPALLVQRTPTSPLRASNQPGGMTLNISSQYAQSTFQSMTDYADGIVVGRVSNISAAQWNQDDGKYWDDTQDPANTMASFPFHYLEVDVLETIVNTSELPSPLQITVLSDHVSLDAEGNVTNEGEGPEALAVGDQVVIFAREAELAWRGGPRPALVLIGVPSQSYFKLNADGLYQGHLLDKPLPLDELIALIRAERETLPEATATPARP